MNLNQNLACMPALHGINDDAAMQFQMAPEIHVINNNLHSAFYGDDTRSEVSIAHPPSLASGVAPINIVPAPPDIPDGASSITDLHIKRAHQHYRCLL